MTTDLRKGRVCPTPGCGTPAELDDLFCSAGCGHEFTDADPIVMLNADGTVHDPNQADDQSEPDHAAPTPAAPPAVSQQPVVVTPTPAVLEPHVSAPVEPVGQAVATTPEPAATAVADPASAASSTSVLASAKLCYIEVSVDLEPRPLRPDDVVAPKVASAGYTLNGKSIPFGRLSPIIPIVGDPTVSRVHGYFHRTEEGGYELLCDTDNFTEVDGVELQKGQTAKLKDGSQVKLGDFFLIVYHED